MCVCLCVFCLEPLEMKIDAQLKRIAAASVEISVHLACFVCVNWSLSPYIYFTDSLFYIGISLLLLLLLLWLPA